MLLVYQESKPRPLYRNGIIEYFHNRAHEVRLKDFKAVFDRQGSYRYELKYV